MEHSKAHQMKTALNDRHRALGAKLVDFCGWEMPVQYQGIIAEHNSVRKNAGLFDVSHMGRVKISGPDAERFLDYLSTNTIAGKTDFSATYTVWAMASGGCVDDVIVYRQSKNDFFVVVNAGNRKNDLDHLRREAKAFNVHVQDLYDSEGILSIQGPNSRKIVTKTFAEADSLKHMHFCFVRYEGQDIILSATGYTGEIGFEIYAPHHAIVSLWDRWLQEGKELGLVPVGLGARDTLRLEMGYALYGHELSETISATESVSSWTVKWNKADFLGKSHLEKLESNPEKRSEYGIELIEPGIARQGYEVFKTGERIGIVTSGTQSPTLNKAIAIILVRGKLMIDDIVEVQIRQQRCKGKVTKLPFKHEG